MTLGLQDRVALITGASRGIGYAIAKALQEQGVRVALIARDEDALKTAAATLPSPGPNDVLTLGADVTDTESVRNAVAKAHSWGGRLDIVVNSAGPEVTFRSWLKPPPRRWQAPSTPNCWAFTALPRQPCLCSATPGRDGSSTSPERQR
jgi:3-oxoacyl-[acyl-carrier protein] reductase